MILYNYPMSGNCYKVRLLLSVLGIEYENVLVDLRANEEKQPKYMNLNPLGMIPILEDGEVVIRDSQAILVYLARRYDASAKWLPDDPVGMAEVVQWLSFAANEIMHSITLSRGIVRMNRPGNLDDAQARARKVLGILNSRLSETDWLVGDRVTIAEMACYPYVSVAHEAGISVDEYDAVQAWLKRVEQLPGYVACE